jgi:hypothetical protein
VTEQPGGRHAASLFHKQPLTKNGRSATLFARSFRK